MNILVKILILASLTLSMNIPCETINNRNISHTYDLSPREKIVSTSYNFDMIIDNLDGTVSKSIMDQGIWQISIVHLTAYFLKPHFQVLNVGSQTGL